MNVPRFNPQDFAACCHSETLKVQDILAHTFAGHSATFYQLRCAADTMHTRTDHENAALLETFLTTIANARSLYAELDAFSEQILQFLTNNAISLKLHAAQGIDTMVAKQEVGTLHAE